MGGNLIIYNSDRDSLSASAGSSTEEYYLSISNILWESWEQFSMSRACWVLGAKTNLLGPNAPYLQGYCPGLTIQ